MKNEDELEKTIDETLSFYLQSIPVEKVPTKYVKKIEVEFVNGNKKIIQSGGKEKFMESLMAKKVKENIIKIDFVFDFKKLREDVEKDFNKIVKF
ncbi:MAG: hypothetical protein NZZ41_00090 [Candidatus Dojkabacteria bacterium]|nr:hypothetical protein [Candidatus Dojkabacteria bacterium]